jgi:anti-sigma factor RsiW
MKHFSEAELLETHYTQPGESMPVMLHLASCTECAAKYERLEKKLRGLTSCASEKPQTFWTRQRMLIMRGVEKQRSRGESAARTWRVAAAAVLAFILGGSVVYETVKPAPPPPVVIAQPQPKVEDPTHDAWQSDELRDFHGIVQWETWVDGKNEGGNSL